MHFTTDAILTHESRQQSTGDGLTEKQYNRTKIELIEKKLTCLLLLSLNVDLKCCWLLKGFFL